MLIFEKSRPGRGCDLLPECDVEVTLPQEKDKERKTSSARAFMKLN